MSLAVLDLRCFGLFYAMDVKADISEGAGFPADDLKKVGARLKALRIAKGHPSHEKFAFENDLNRSQYWRYEKGIDLRLSSFFKVLKALNVTYQEFFSEGFD